MARSIAVIGGKGGVGKTTVVANLSAALARLGYDVMAIDANFTTPNLGLHLGLHLASNTIHQVLRNEKPVWDAVYWHPAGFRVIPGSLNLNYLVGLDLSKFSEILTNFNSDFILSDSAAGLGKEAIASLEACDEILVVANPELPSLADGLRVLKLGERLNKQIVGIVVNRVKRERHELSRKKVEEFMGYPVLAEIPEDSEVRKAVAKRVPVVEFNPRASASIEFNYLAHKLIGFPFKRPHSLRVLEKLASWLKRA